MRRRSSMLMNSWMLLSSQNLFTSHQMRFIPFILFFCNNKNFWFVIYHIEKNAY